MRKNLIKKPKVKKAVVKEREELTGGIEGISSPKCPYCKSTNTLLSKANDNTSEGFCNACDTTYYFIKLTKRTTYYESSDGKGVLSSAKVERPEYETAHGWRVQHRVHRTWVDCPGVDDLDKAFEICSEKYPDWKWDRRTTWGSWYSKQVQV